MIYKYNTFIYLAWYVYSSWAIVRPKLILGLFRVDFGLTWCWSKVYFKFCADVRVCIYICIYIYVCICIYICIYACVRMDVYIYKHSIQNRTNNIINIYILYIYTYIYMPTLPILVGDAETSQLLRRASRPSVAFIKTRFGCVTETPFLAVTVVTGMILCWAEELPSSNLGMGMGRLPMSWWCSMFFPGNTNFKDNCTKRYLKGFPVGIFDFQRVYS